LDLSRARPVAVAPGVRPIRGLVFDKDGTLFDFHATWSGWAAGFIEAMTRGRPERTDTLAAALGFDLGARRFARDSPVIAGTMEVVVEAVRRVVPEMGEPVLRQLIIDGTVAAPQAEAAPLGPLFDVLLEAGLVLGLATNDSEVPARAHLERAGILGRFVFVAGYDSGHGAKPGPGQLEAFCRATGLPAETCAMVGDSRHDLASGRAAGMVTVGVLTGLAGPEDLADLADVILPDIGMLPAWLGL
jgi:phosphoglycolate phosphatase